VETVAHLREELERVPAAHQVFKPGRPWYLYTSPPMQRLELKKLTGLTLEQLGLVPRSYVNVGLE